MREHQIFGDKDPGNHEPSERKKPQDSKRLNQAMVIRFGGMSTVGITINRDGEDDDPSCGMLKAIKYGEELELLYTPFSHSGNELEQQKICEELIKWRC